MEKVILSRILLPVLTVLMSGCATLPDNQLEVPFRAQPSPNHCGVNCLAMAFDYFSIPYDVAELETHAFVPALNGSPPELLADVAETYGLQAELDDLAPDAIKSAIESGLLPIVFIPPAEGEPIGHFILVTGTGNDPRNIRTHDGEHKNRRRRLSDKTYVTLLLSTLGKAHDET